MLSKIFFLVAGTVATPMLSVGLSGDAGGSSSNTQVQGAFNDALRSARARIHSALGKSFLQGNGVRIRVMDGGASAGNSDVVNAAAEFENLTDAVISELRSSLSKSFLENPGDAAGNLGATDVQVRSGKHAHNGSNLAVVSVWCLGRRWCLGCLCGVWGVGTYRALPMPTPSGGGCLVKESSSAYTIFCTL